MKNYTWRDKIYFSLKQKDVENILALYNIAERFSFKPVYGGWRKACFLIRLSSKKKFVLVIYPPKNLTPKQIVKAIIFEQIALKKGFPCRKIFKTKNNRFLIAHETDAGKIYAALFSFLPGKIVHPYKAKHITEAAKWLAKLHHSFKRKGKQTLVHHDFGRGNLLFDSRGKLSGIIDFEEADWGSPQKDIRKTLSFFFKDCPKIAKDDIKLSFLRTYDRYSCQK